MFPSHEENQVRQKIVDLLPRLRSYAIMLTRNREDANDLVQETLVKGLTHLDRFTPGTNLKAWLYTILRNTFYNDVARRRKERSGQRTLESSAPDLIDGPQEWNLRLEEAMDRIHALQPPYRDAFLLVAVIGESYEDAARICDCQIGTIKSRLNRARTLLGEEGGAAQTQGPDKSSTHSSERE